MVLKGVIDAAVNGGIEKYKEAFFSEEFAKNNQDKKNSIESLKENLREQLQIVSRGLAIHSKLGKAAMRRKCKTNKKKN